MDTTDIEHMRDKLGFVIPFDSSGLGTLEQIRDIYPEEVNSALVNEIVKKYFYARQKSFNFYKAWKRFEKEDEKR